MTAPTVRILERLVEADIPLRLRGVAGPSDTYPGLVEPCLAHLVDAGLAKRVAYAGEDAWQATGRGVYFCRKLS